MSTPRLFRRLPIKAVLIPMLLGVALILVAACSSNDPTNTPRANTPTATATSAPQPTATLAPQPTATGTPVRVLATEYKFDPSVASVPAGKVTFELVNQGAMEHEMVVLKTDLPIDALPMRANDPNKVDEDAAGQAQGEIEEIGPGVTETLTLDLAPGRYLLVCNLPGHYKLGMVTEFIVKATATEASPVAAPGTPVSVIGQDFTLEPSVASVPAGEVTFEFANQGSVEHEMVVLKTDLPIDALPMRANDPNRVDEDAAGLSPGEIEEIGPGVTETLTLDLAPGRYLLLCNVPAHYKLGMVTEFIVK